MRVALCMTSTARHDDRPRALSPGAVATAQGWFNVVGGVWPIVGIGSFEKIFGPKADRWLEYTVAGLLVTNGTAQLLAARSGELGSARLLGRGTAATLLVIDVVFVSRGRLRWTYLIDAVFESGWLALWRAASAPRRPHGRRAG